MAAAHVLPGRPVLVQLEPPDVALLAAGFEAEAERLDAISEVPHQDIAERLDRRPQMVGGAV